MNSKEVTSRRSQEVARPGRRRGATILVASLVTAALALAFTGGYVAWSALAPIPEPAVEFSADSQTPVTTEAATTQNSVNSEPLPTAIGWLHDEAVWSNDPTPHPLASITKLITVLVALEQAPLEPGADGPVHVWSQADSARQDYYLSIEGVAYPIPVGTSITTRQMLTLIFLPSANDYAAAYAYSVFGDNSSFVAAVEAWKARHGLDSITIVEPTGLDERNVASAADLVRVARLALDNPTVTEFTSTATAELPWGIGTVENTNPLLGVLPGILGVKTGSLNTVGYNYIVAQQSNASGRELVKIAVTLGRNSKVERAASGSQMLELMDGLAQTAEVVAEGETVGVAVAADGTRTSLLAAGSASTVLVPGESVGRIMEVEVPPVGKTGDRVGVTRVQTPSGTEEVAVALGGPIQPPDLWWRVTHPAALFG